MSNNNQSTYIVNVADYGVIANSGMDAAEGIRKAVYAASTHGDGSVVKFAEGTYLIASVSPQTPKDTFHTLYFENLNNITIEGNNTTLLIADPFMDPFFFTRCKSVTVKGFKFDYKTYPWSQGEVVDIDKENATFKFKVDNLSFDGKCPLDDPRWLEVRTSRCATSPFGMVRNDDNPLLLKKGIQSFFWKFTTPVKCETGVYEIGFTDEKYKLWIGTNIKLGTKLVLNNRTDSIGVVRCKACRGNITVEDCIIHASNGTIFCIGRIDGDVTIKNVKVLLKENNWVTSNADGMYLSDINGKVTVKDCLFEGIGDDCLNLYCYSGAILTEVISPKEIKVKGVFLPEIGDTITVNDPIKGQVRGTAKVIAKQDYKTGDNIEVDNTVLLTLDSDIEGITAGTTRQNGDVVFRHSMLSPNSEFVNNTFRYGRAKGLKLNIREFKVENNTFENLGYGAIMLHDIPALSENPGVSHAKIINNTISNCGYLMSWDSERNASIAAYGMRVDGGEAEGKIHNDITISSNRINHVTKVGIYVSSATDVVIENNVINSDITDGETVKMGGVTLQNVDGVTIKGTVVSDPRPCLQGGIRILNDCENVVINDNSFSLAKDVLEIYKL